MPDFRENHSEILTRLAETIENPVTQQMLATFEDIRQSTLKRGIDIMSLQMQMLEAVFANPHM